MNTLENTVEENKRLRLVFHILLNKDIYHPYGALQEQSTICSRKDHYFDLEKALTKR